MSLLDQQPSVPALSGTFARFNGLFRRNATWVLIDQAVASLGNFLTINLLVRYMPKSEWGVFSVLFETILYLNSLQAALLIYPLTIRGATGNKENLGRLATASILLTLGMLPLLGAATAASVGVLAGVQTIGAAVAALLLWQLQETTRRALMSELRFADAVWGDAVSYLGQAIFIFIAARTGHLNLMTAFVGMAVTSALGIAIQAAQIGLKPVGLQHLRQIAADFWTLGRWMLLNNAGGLVSSLSYWYVLRGKWGNDAAAVFGAIVAMFKLANPVMSSIGNLIVPAVARKAKESGARSTKRIALRYIAMGASLLAPFYLFLGLFPELSLRLFYGRETEYSQYGILLRLFVANYTMSFFSSVVGAWLLGLGHSRLGFNTQLVNMLVTVLFGLAMTYNWGVSGLILGGMAAITCTAITAAYYLRRVMRGLIPAVAEVAVAGEASRPAV